MAKHHRAAENKPEQKRRSKTRPVAAESTYDRTSSAGQIGLSEKLIDAANGGAIQVQATHLDNPRLRTAQRQALAASIGRLQGNQHLQRLITQMRPNERKPNQADVRTNHGPLLVGVMSEPSEAIQRAEDEEEKLTQEGEVVEGSLPGPKGATREEELIPEAREEDVLQADFERNVTPWGSTYMSVEIPAINDTLIGKLDPSQRGSYQIPYDYDGRLAYKGDAYAGIDGPGGRVSHGGRAGLTEALKFHGGLPSTNPGRYTSYLGNRGGTFADALEAREPFAVVDPVRINLGSRRSRDIYDFSNPIPVQLEGGVKLEFQLSASHVQQKRVGVSASGSNSNSISDKMSFGVNFALDNDEGSKGEGELGFSTETAHHWREQWQREEYHRREIKLDEWKKETFELGPGESARSKMIIPQYEWVEWDAVVYPHNPSNLTTTGGPDNVVIGMLRPTGWFRSVISTDPGLYSDSDPTAEAQVEPGRLPGAMEEQYEEQVAARGNWRTLPGAKWGNETFQFIQGPVSMQPAGRDYGVQIGEGIHPGSGSVTVGTRRSLTLEDGMVASHSQENEHVTTNNESRSLEANPGIKGLGSIGDRLSFENSSSVSGATGTGLSTEAGSSEQTQVEVTHQVNKKPRQWQYMIFTPLVNHKVFKIAYGAQQPPPGVRGVNPNEACDIIYIHTYQHQPIPHVKLMDVGRDEEPSLGRNDWPDYTPI
jgi:hypothetical protein